jgi:molybdate transport system permease protein
MGCDFMDENIWFSVILTAKIVLVTIIPLLLFTFLVAYLSMKRNPILDYLIDFIVSIPLIFPPISIGFLLVILFSKKGILGSFFKMDLIFSFEGIVLAAFLAGMPFMTKSVISGIKGGVYELCEASYTLGKGEIQTFFMVVVPFIKKNILYGMVLAVGRMVGEVGMSLMIGGNIPNKTNTISLEIYNALLDGETDKALLLSLILFVFSSIVFIFIKFMDKGV